jgi:hypothetical protein
VHLSGQPDSLNRRQSAGVVAPQRIDRIQHRLPPRPRILLAVCVPPPGAAPSEPRWPCQPRPAQQRLDR